MRLFEHDNRAARHLRQLAAGLSTTRLLRQAGWTLLSEPFFPEVVIGRLKTSHRWALQNRQVNRLVNMPELLFRSA